MVTSGQEHRLRIFGKWTMRRLFARKRKGGNGGTDKIE